MTDVSLIHTSGGLIGDVVTDSLRQPDVEGDAKFLTVAATFTGLNGAAPTKTQLASDQEAAFRTGVALWSAYADELKGGMDISRIRERLVLKLLDLLGFAPVYQRSKLHAGGQAWTISHLGWDGDGAPPIHTVAAADLDERGGGKRSPHEELQGYLNAVPERWGILTNGRVLRLLRDYHHTRSRGYIEFDLAAIFEASSWPDCLALWRLCHASRFQPIATTEPAAAGDSEEAAEDDDDAATVVDDAPGSLLEELYAKALSAGVAAGRRLQPQVRAAISLLANGIIDANPNLRAKLENTPDLGRDLFRELLTVLYRTLFLLFAEQRGMLEGADPLYQDSYSLTRLRAIATDGSSEPRRMDLWEGLKTTFRVFSNETEAALLGVYPYNGFLFDQTRTPLTSGAHIANWYLTRAIEELTTVQTGKVRLHIDYRNLGVEELGTVYESLLDYTLAIAAKAESVDGRLVHPGEAYLAPLSIDRADLASYYTPVELTDLLLTRTLDPLITDTLAAAGDEPAAQVDALLDLKIIDPACGSAAILIGALDRIAYAVARARTTPHEPRDIDLVHARRDVLQRCIYGAEKDPFATELAKVALWIHCVVPDQPLTFLDHHIVCGDSLVGWPLLNVPRTIPDDAYRVSSAKGAERSMLTKALARNEKFTAAGGDLYQQESVEFTLTLPAELQQQEHTPEDVRAKAAAYRDWIDSLDYARWKQTADLWTAAFFWTNTATGSAAPTSVEYAAALGGNPDPALAKAAADLLADIKPLHWPLAFPEAHAAGGFDLVLGNPPWEQYKGEEQPFFKQHKPAIAAMTSETRKKAIAALEADEPEMFDRWRKYQSGQNRLAHYAKSCGRFTRTSNEANTYVLFTELAANSSSHVGLIVKSGIATDAAQSPVWKKLLDGGRVREVLDMVNQEHSGKRVFPAVAAVERFVVLHLVPSSTENLQASMLNFGVAAAASRELRSWSRQQLRIASPRTETLLSTDDPREIDLALVLQDRFDTLDFADADGANPWGLKYASLFHSSGAKAKGLLLRGPALEEQGFTLGRDKRYTHSDGRIAVPVYEGQMANRWDHRARTFEGFTGKDRYGRKPHIPWVTDEQHADPEFEVEPRYWMHEKVAEARIAEVSTEDQIPMALRDIGRSWTDRRIVRVAVMEDLVAATDTLPMIFVDRKLALKAAAVWNSMTFDFLVRVHMPGGHVKLWLPSQCSAPRPDEIPVEVIQVAGELSLTSTCVARAMEQPVRKWDPARRESLDAKCDALVAKAYGLTTADYEVVLDHFKLLAKIETKNPELGEYRSKRLRLEAFEEIGGNS